MICLVLRGGSADILLEHLVEVLAVVESAVVGDALYRPVGDAPPAPAGPP